MSDLPTLCLDFDGVIHDYWRGWQDGAIYGELTPGFLDWAYDAGKLFRLVVYSSRSKTIRGVVSMADWVAKKATEEGWLPTAIPYRLPDTDSNLRLRLKHAKHVDGVSIGFEFAHEKPPAFLTIDDRCVRFDGSWNNVHVDPKVLRAFRPWMNK